MCCGSWTSSWTQDWTYPSMVEWFSASLQKASACRTIGRIHWCQCWCWILSSSFWRPALSDMGCCRQVYAHILSRITFVCSLYICWDTLRWFGYMAQSQVELHWLSKRLHLGLFVDFTSLGVYLGRSFPWFWPCSTWSLRLGYFLVSPAQSASQGSSTQFSTGTRSWLLTTTPGLGFSPHGRTFPGVLTLTLMLYSLKGRLSINLESFFLVNPKGSDSLCFLMILGLCIIRRPSFEGSSLAVQRWLICGNFALGFPLWKAYPSYLLAWSFLDFVSGLVVATFQCSLA